MGSDHPRGSEDEGWHRKRLGHAGGDYGKLMPRLFARARNANWKYGKGTRGFRLMAQSYTKLTMARGSCPALTRASTVLIKANCAGVVARSPFLS